MEEVEEGVEVKGTGGDKSSLGGAVCNNSNAVRSENEGGKYHLRFAMLEV